MKAKKFKKKVDELDRFMEQCLSNIDYVSDTFTSSFGVEYCVEDIDRALETLKANYEALFRVQVIYKELVVKKNKPKE